MDGFNPQDDVHRNHPLSSEAMFPTAVCPQKIAAVPLVIGRIGEYLNIGHAMVEEHNKLSFGPSEPFVNKNGQHFGLFYAIFKGKRPIVDKFVHNAYRPIYLWRLY